MTDQPEKMNLGSMDLTEEKKQELLRLFPEICTEGGKIDFERLKLALGELVDVGKERYGMNWPGKADCFRTLQAPSTGTLLPCPEESVHFDSTENLIIEGDNLEVLKLLQKAYLGRVKMIYIDPPYNTGNDFIYPDNYTESLQTYLEFTGQVDNEGHKFGTNNDTDGRFHSRWINMMYPRLYLARNLLRDDGVIFISIDDNEISNLKKLANEIFGEENFISTISRVMKTGGAKGNFFTPNIDYILIYAKNILSTEFFRGSRTKDQIDRYYNKIEMIGERKGEIYGEERIYKASLDPRPNQRYWIECPDGSFVIPPGVSFPERVEQGIKVTPTSEDGVWKWIFERYDEELKKGNIVFKETTTSALIDSNGKQSKWNIYNKVWLRDQEEKGIVPSNFIVDFENRQSAAELKELGIPFDFAKPVNLIKYLLQISGTSDDGTILDFFAGSGTTAQSVLDLNEQVGGKCKFILVQLPETCSEDSEAYKSGYKTIAEITKERVRRVIKKLNDADAGQLPLGERQDRGFRVFKLAESNFTPWDAQAPQDADSLARQLELHIEHIRAGRSPDDLLYEILLKSGFPLTTAVERLTLEGKQVFSVAGGALLICLEPQLTMEVMRAMAAQKPERVVCLDAGFAGNDQLKANAVQIFKTQGIPSFKTV